MYYIVFYLMFFRLGVWKLGKHADSAGTWSVDMDRLEKPLFACPICNLWYSSTLSRRNHENKAHSFPTECLKSCIDSIPALEDTTTSTEQQEFLVYLNLVKRMSTDSNMAGKLASRKQLLKSLKLFGNVTGSYKCYFCQ